LLASGLIFLLLSCAVFAARPEARFGAVLFDRTTVASVGKSLGAGKAVPPLGGMQGRAWHDARRQITLILYEVPAQRTGVLAGVLSREAVSATPADLGALSGPGGIRLGDTLAAVQVRLGSGQLQGRRDTLETYNWYGFQGFRKKPRKPPESMQFILQATFDGGRLIRIYLFEES